MVEVYRDFEAIRILFVINNKRIRNDLRKKYSDRSERSVSSEREH